MMNISYITHTDIPSKRANSLQSMKMCQALAQNGHDVLLIARQGAKKNDFTNIASFYDLATSFPTKLLTPYHPPLGNRMSNFVARYQFLWQAAQAVKEQKPDVIFTRFLPIAAWATRQGIPTIWEAHAIDGNQTEQTLLRVMSVGKQSKRVVAITEALKRDLTDTYPKSFEQLEMIVAPDGVDLPAFSNLPSKTAARQKFGLPESEVVAGFVGQFYPGKGADFILQIAETAPDICFLLVGGAPKDQARLQQIIRQKKLSNIQLRDFVPQEDVPSYLRACDALLLPLQPKVLILGKKDIARWTSPLKMFEYMAAERPILATDMPILKEVLDEDNSLLCPVEPPAWANSLRQCRQNQALGQRLAAQAAQDVKQYSWQNRAASCLVNFAV